MKSKRIICLLDVLLIIGFIMGMSLTRAIITGLKISATGEKDTYIDSYNLLSNCGRQDYSEGNQEQLK